MSEVRYEEDQKYRTCNLTTREKQRPNLSKHLRWFPHSCPINTPLPTGMGLVKLIAPKLLHLLRAFTATQDCSAHIVEEFF